MSHTPRPWIVELDENGDLWVRIPGHDLFIGNIEDTCGECHANAHLIAAAPELLEACETFLEWSTTEHTSYTEFRAVQDKCRTAIAKAKGEAT